jgi:WD40 repeat protein
MQVIKAHTKRINDLAFSPDGNTLVSGGIDGTVRVHDTQIGTSSVLIPPPKSLPVYWERVAFCPDGEHVLCRSSSSLQVWNIVTRRRVAELLSGPAASYLRGVAVSSTRFLAVAPAWRPRGNKCVIRCWDTRTWEEADSVEAGNTLFPGLAFDSTGTRLATSIGLFDVTTGERLLDASFTGYQLDWSPTAPLVAGVVYGNVITVTSAETGSEVKRLSLAKKFVQDFGFSRDGRFLAAVSNEAVVRVWNTENWKEEKEFAWGIGKLKCIAFAPDGLRAACASESGRILIWDWDL